jgi:hypothetical protein
MFIVLLQAAPLSPAQDTSLQPPANCPVTKAPEPFVPPASFPFHPASDKFYFGSEELWTQLPADGVSPQVRITARRLGSVAPDMAPNRGNGAFIANEGSFITSGAAFPTLGCWEVTGQFEDAKLNLCHLGSLNQRHSSRLNHRFDILSFMRLRNPHALVITAALAAMIAAAQPARKVDESVLKNAGGASPGNRATPLRPHLLVFMLDGTAALPTPPPAASATAP